MHKNFSSSPDKYDPLGCSKRLLFKCLSFCLASEIMDFVKYNFHYFSSVLAFMNAKIVKN